MSDHDITAPPQGFDVQMAKLDGKLEVLTLGLNTLSRTHEQVVADLRKVTELSFAHQDHDASIKRIWTELAERDRKWDTRLATVEGVHTTTRDKVLAMRWYAGGVASVAMLLVLLLAYVGQGAINDAAAARAALNLRQDKAAEQQAADARAADQRLDNIEIHLAGDPNRPYRR